MNWHSKYCRLVAEYKLKYPQYCKTCGGWGGVWDRYDPSPAGVSLSPGYMEDFEPCPDCYGATPPKCPRCGCHYLRWVIEIDEGIDMSPCPECGWSEKDNVEGIPQPPEYYCEDD